MIATVPVRACAVCSKLFGRKSTMHTVCSYPCTVKQSKAKEREAKQAAAADKRQTRAQLEALKTIPKLKKEAQTAFNAFIRARDRRAGYACICCNKPLDWDGGKGGTVDAGHYRSTGSADHLRFNEANCHAQRSDCNRYGAGRAVDYRIGLIHRIGLAAVEAIEATNDTVKWTREELRATRDMYRRRARDLSKQLETE